MLALILLGLRFGDGSDAVYVRYCSFVARFTANNCVFFSVFSSADKQQPSCNMSPNTIATRKVAHIRC